MEKKSYGIFVVFLCIVILFFTTFKYCLNDEINTDNLVYAEQLADIPTDNDGDSEDTEVIRYVKEVNDVDETYEEEVREITREKKQQLYDYVCEVESQIDVIEELIKARDEIDLPENYDPISIDWYLRDINSALYDYSEYRPYLEDLLYEDFNENMTYSFFNWFKKIFFKIVTAVGVAALRAFNWDLSAELLSHARNNTCLDSVYYPVNIGKISESPTFNDILSSNKLHDCKEFIPDVDGKDLFYSLAHFDYYKTESNSVVELCDRYDFDPDSSYGSDLVDIANYIGSSSQEVGEIIPYQVIIDIVYEQSPETFYDSMEDCSYGEKVITMGKNEKTRLDLCFSGKYIVQTVGSKSTEIKLYEDGNLKETYQGGGVYENTLFFYDFSEGNYSIEISLIGSRNAGSTKVVFVKYDYSYGAVDTDIFAINYSTFNLYSYTKRDNADINSLTPCYDAMYQFSTNSDKDDLTIYVIDPRSARAVKNIEDNPDNKYLPSVYGHNLIMEKTLTSDVPYLLIITKADNCACNFVLSCDIV